MKKILYFVFGLLTGVTIGWVSCNLYVKMILNEAIDDIRKNRIFNKDDEDEEEE